MIHQKVRLGVGKVTRIRVCTLHHTVYICILLNVQRGTPIPCSVRANTLLLDLMDRNRIPLLTIWQTVRSHLLKT